MSSYKMFLQPTNTISRCLKLTSSKSLVPIEDDIEEYILRARISKKPSTQKGVGNPRVILQKMTKDRNF